MPTPPKKKSASSQKAASSKTTKAPSTRAPKFPLSAKRTKDFIAEEKRTHHHSPHAAKLARKVKDAREEVRDPMNADPTEVLKLFKPTERELEARGLPRDFLGGDDGEDDKSPQTRRKRKCSNNTVLFMADFID